VKDYFAQFFVENEGMDRLDKPHVAWGIVQFSARGQKHAERKLRAGLDGLQDKLPDEYKNNSIHLYSRAYKSVDEIPVSHLPHLGKIELP
jgi:hypothetical protein